MKNLLRVIATPSCWLQNYTYSSLWDRELRRMLDKGDKIVIVDNYYVKIGGVEVWVENYPYAYGRPNGIEIRPSRSTVLRLHDAVLVVHLKNAGVVI